jgi:hypothetical protein
MTVWTFMLLVHFWKLSQVKGSTMLEDTVGYLFDIDTVLSMRLCCTILRHSAWSSQTDFMIGHDLPCKLHRSVPCMEQTQSKVLPVKTYSICLQYDHNSHNQIERSVWIKWIVIPFLSHCRWWNILEIQWILGASTAVFDRDCVTVIDRDTTFLLSCDQNGLFPSLGGASMMKPIFLPPYTTVPDTILTKNHAFEFSEVYCRRQKCVHFSLFFIQKSRQLVSCSFLWSLVSLLQEVTFSSTNATHFTPSLSHFTALSFFELVQSPQNRHGNDYSTTVPIPFSSIACPFHRRVTS